MSFKVRSRYSGSFLCRSIKSSLHPKDDKALEHRSFSEDRVYANKNPRLRDAATKSRGKKDHDWQKRAGGLT